MARAPDSSSLFLLFITINFSYLLMLKQGKRRLIHAPTADHVD
jgi:hypothetical protein